MVVVPRPPLLDPTATLDERAVVVAVTAAGAIWRRFPRKGMSLHRVRAGALASKHAPVYRALAEALTGSGIAPGAWLAWSAEAWRRHIAPGRGAPSVAWLCKASRVVDYRDWFMGDHILYDGGQTWLGARHRALINRWEAMRRETLQVVERTGSLDRARRVVQRHFPDGVYDVLVARARDEARHTQRMLMDQVSKGVCLW